MSQVRRVCRAQRCTISPVNRSAAHRQARLTEPLARLSLCATSAYLPIPVARSMRGDNKICSLCQQLVVHDPASYVQAVKQQLVEKAGIPPLEQRLIFTSPRAFVARRTTGRPTQTAAPRLLARG